MKGLIMPTKYYMATLDVKISGFVFTVYFTQIVGLRVSFNEDDAYIATKEDLMAALDATFGSSEWELVRVKVMDSGVLGLK
jgi:hypothetical protein